MNRSNPLATMINQARANGAAFWAARTEQERRFLGVGGAVLGVLLVYGVLIAPALNGREQLQKDLPVLRQRAGEARETPAATCAPGAAGLLSRAPITRRAADL